MDEGEALASLIESALRYGSDALRAVRGEGGDDSEERCTASREKLCGVAQSIVAHSSLGSWDPRVAVRFEGVPNATLLHVSVEGRPVLRFVLMPHVPNLIRDPDLGL